MKKFKIVQSFIIEAPDKAGALEQFSKAINQLNFLESQYIKEVEQKGEGWKKAFAKQL